MNDPDRRPWSDGFDDEAIFADIVAHLNDDVAQEDPTPRPASEHESAENMAAGGETTIETTEEATAEPATDSADLPGERSQAGPSQWPSNPPPWRPTHDDPPAEPVADPQAAQHADAQAVPAPQQWRAHEVDSEYEDHFEPPPVSPLPAGDLQFWAIIVGMCGGPLLLLYLVLFNRDAGGYWILTAIGMSVGGFALLVSRMPGHHEDDDDDGARL